MPVQDTQTGQKNYNGMQPNNYRISFGYRKELPIWAQRLVIPGVAGNSPIEQSTPMRSILHPGHGVTLNGLSISFIVDEDMNNWLSLFQWIMECHMASSEADINDLLYRDQQGTKLLQSHRDIVGSTDATILCLTNKKNPMMKVTLGKMFPVALSDVELLSTSGGADQRTATVDFKFNHIKFESLRENYDPILEDPGVKAWLETQRRIAAEQPVFTP